MKKIHPLELEALIEANEPVEVIDVRPLDEFEKRHMVGAHWIPSEKLTPEALIHSRELPFPEPVYLMSGTGRLAQQTAEKLERSGLDNLVVIEAGMQGWDQNALPVDRRHSLTNWLHEHRRKMIDSGAAADFPSIEAS